MPAGIAYSREATPERTVNRSFGRRGSNSSSTSTSTSSNAVGLTTAEQDLRWRRYSELSSNLNPIIHDKEPAPSSTPDSRSIDLIVLALQRPRTVTVLVLLLLALVYAALQHSETAGFAANVKLGMMSSFVAFVFIGVLQFSDGPFIRPHPAFWRAILAISIVYLTLLIFLVFQNVDDARKLMSFYDSNLGVPLPEKSYAEDCRITVESMLDQMDIFIIAHVLGWFCKALILRDVWLCWILSVMFEVMEYSLEHQLPNFAECWWDHWILDVLVCNWLGIYAGMKTCEYFTMKTYSWRGFHEIKSVTEGVQRTVEQFTPYSWTQFDWAATKSPKNFFALIVLITIFLQCELNAFYLKAILWIPPEHHLNTVRLVIFFFIGVVAVREAYQFLTDPKCKRLGFQAWLTIATIQIETLVCYRFGKDMFQQPTPPHVLVFWALFTSALVLFALHQFVYLRRQEEATKAAEEIQCTIGGGDSTGTTPDIKLNESGPVEMRSTPHRSISCSVTPSSPDMESLDRLELLVPTAGEKSSSLSVVEQDGAEYTSSVSSRGRRRKLRSFLN